MFGFQILRRRSHLVALTMLVFVVASMTYFSNTMAKRLATEEKSKMHIWAEAYRVIGSESSSEEASALAMEVITSNETIPMLILDESGSIVSRNIRLPKKDEEVFVKNKLEEYKKNEDFPPIKVSLIIGGSIYTNYIYYGPSNLLRRLALFPYWQIVIIIIFVIAAYLFFNASKRDEENRVWVGLSKETAHQLGTPISSLFAWVELLRSGHQSPEMVNEMQKDIVRLETVANRFSKIGSKLTLEMCNLTDVLDESVSYMTNRITKRVVVEKQYEREAFIPVLMNAELFEWVIENLIKNAVDAMRGGGKIIIDLVEDEQAAYIDVIDQGKGMSKNRFKEIFTPGFSSKKRGWGLGLSFAKRIIKDYHHGKIFVKKSEIDKGTTFRIILPKCKVEE